jgi:4-hydroxy-2-oxoglutarate aldolase
MKLQGIFADITTPFDHKGDIYKVKVQHNVEKWNKTTLAGYVVCGAAGEGVLLSAEEKIAVWEMVAKFAAPEKLLIAAAASAGVRETVTLANRAADLGYKAALIDSPYRDASTQLIYFRAIADQSRIPLIVGSEIAVQHPNVAAVCDRSATAARDGVQVLASSASHLWSMLQSGASGAILDFAAAAPYAAIAIWEAHRTREEEAGREMQGRMMRAAEVIHSASELKHAMDLNAYYGGPPRLPLVVPAADTRRQIEEAFRDLKG